MQALTGNTMALFLSEMLLEAIDDLSNATTTTNRHDLLVKLQEDEQQDYARFLASPAPDPPQLEKVPLDADLLTQQNVSIFFRSPSICHGATLPSMSRYLGILTESNQTGVHDYEYFRGIHIQEAKKLDKKEEETTMPLVWDNAEEKETNCPLEIQRDHKDYFYVSEKMGVRTLTVPNTAELQAYGRTPSDGNTLHGIVVLCQIRCPWNRCPKGAMRQEDIHNGNVWLEVNGERVQNITAFGNECFVLRGENGHRFPPNDDGQFVLHAKVERKDSLLRISAMIIL
jgi:hypothetical protein